MILVGRGFRYRELVLVLSRGGVERRQPLRGEQRLDRRDVCLNIRAPSSLEELEHRVQVVGDEAQRSTFQRRLIDFPRTDILLLDDLVSLGLEDLRVDVRERDRLGKVG